MRLLEITRQLKPRRKFREGAYTINVDLENPGDEFQEFLKVRIAEGEQEVAKAIFKQWEGKHRWEPLSLSINEHSKRETFREMIYTAAQNAGFFIKD